MSADRKTLFNGCEEHGDTTIFLTSGSHKWQEISIRRVGIHAALYRVIKMNLDGDRGA